MQISVVIPVHNEEEFIQNSVLSFIGQLAPATKEKLQEIILVENGSTDGSLGACRQLETEHPGFIRTIESLVASYGEAIKTGLLQSRGSHISILECDFLDVDFLEGSVRLFEEQQARFILASKRHVDSKDGRPFRRRLFTAGLNLLLRITTGYPGSDTRGLKSIEADLARQLCGLAVTSDEFFQTEITLLAWNLGVPPLELPITIQEVRVTPVSTLKRIPAMLRMPLELRRSLSRDLRGMSKQGE
jgi:glycosyltransferase involved in cell wall biosynthesis